MLQQVMFREVRAGEAQQVWIHPSGRQAVMLLAPRTDLGTAWRALQEVGDSGEMVDWHDLIALLKDLRPKPEGIALSTCKGAGPGGTTRFFLESSGRLAWTQFFRNARTLLRRGQASPSVLQPTLSRTVDLGDESWVLLSEDWMGTEDALQRAGMGFDDLGTARYAAKLRALAKSRPYSALLFPVLEQITS